MSSGMLYKSIQELYQAKYYQNTLTIKINENNAKNLKNCKGNEDINFS